MIASLEYIWVHSQPGKQGIEEIVTFLKKDQGILI